MDNKLAEYRKEKGLTQEQLAEKSGVSRPTIANIECGKQECVMTGTLVKLASALGCKPRDLL